MTFYKWSKTAASNATADSTINWAEGQAPSTVNDSARAEMAANAKWRDDISGTLTTGGSSTAYTLTTNQVFASAAVMSGAQITFIPHADSGAAPTLAVDGLTARALNVSTGVAVPTGYFKTGTPYTVTYIHASTEFIVRNAPAVLPANLVTTAAITDKAVTYAKIQDISATSRLLGRASSGAGVTEEITVGTGLNISGTTITAPAFPPPAVFKNLVIKVASNTTVTVTADYFTTTNGSGAFQTTAVNSTVNLGTTGVDALIGGSGAKGTIAIDTDYHLWVIVKADGTTKVVATTSTTSDATFLSDLANVASGAYTYYGRAGCVKTIHASAILYGTWQIGTEVQYIVGLAGGSPTNTTTPGPIATLNVGTISFPSPTLVSTTVTGAGKYVPTTASHIHIAVENEWKGGAQASIIVAPSQSFSGTNNGPEGSNGLVPSYYTGNGNASQLVGNFWIMLESSAISLATSNNAGALVACRGWRDNL